MSIKYKGKQLSILNLNRTFVIKNNDIMASSNGESSGKAAYKALDDMISKNANKQITEIKQEINNVASRETAKIMPILAQQSATQNELNAKMDIILSTLERITSMRQVGMSSLSVGASEVVSSGGSSLSSAVGTTEPSKVARPINIIAWFKKIGIGKNFGGLRDKYFTPENIELLNQVDNAFRGKNAANEEAYQIAFGHAIWNKMKPQTEAQKAAGESPEPFISKEEKETIVECRTQWNSLEAMTAPREEHLDEE